MDEKWRDLLAEDREVVFFSADVDRIQEYVFESTRLPEIRGASMLVEELTNEAAKNEFLIGYVIYRGGGSLLAILPDMDTATKAKRQIEELFIQKTGVATITCVLYHTTTKELINGYNSAELKPESVWSLRNPNYKDDWQRITTAFGQPISVKQNILIEAVKKQFEAKHHFGQMVELMSVLLRREKDQRRPMPFYETLPHMERCRSCGQRPAVLMGQYNDVIESLWPLCTPCWKKVEDRKTRRNIWIDKAIQVFEEKANYFGQHTQENVRYANDLSDIGQACEARPSYVALIYVDGDSIGQALKRQKCPDKYTQISQKLQHTTHQAIYKSLEQFLRPTKITRKNINDEQGTEETVNIHPFEIIAIGGDDALIIVPADMAIPIAVSICREFTLEFKEESLTMSAGVVIAPANTPIRSLRDIAHQLLKNAKKRVKKLDSKEGGLDFLVLTSQSMLRRNLEHLRNTYPVRLPGEGKYADLCLTAAPFTLTEASLLVELLVKMRMDNFATSQLQQLVAALYKGREAGSLYYLYQQTRLKKRHSEKKLSVLELIETRWPFDPTQDPVPWQAREVDISDPNPDAAYISVLPDLASLFSFVPKDEDRLGRWQRTNPEVTNANSA